MDLTPQNGIEEGKLEDTEMKGLVSENQHESGSELYSGNKSIDESEIIVQGQHLEKIEISSKNLESDKSMLESHENSEGLARNIIELDNEVITIEDDTTSMDIDQEVKDIHVSQEIRPVEEVINENTEMIIEDNLSPSKEILMQTLSESQNIEIPLKTENIEVSDVENSEKLGPCKNNEEILNNPHLKTEETKEIPFNLKSNSQETAEGILKREFGYYFDENLVLKNIETNENFKFVNQKHYEALGDLIQRYVQEKMVEKYEMIEEFIPKNQPGPKCNIFISKNWFDESCSKALILIQGAGAVRAGFWARSVCINDSLKTGSVFPFLDFAAVHNFKVIVLNPNFCYDPKTHKQIPENYSLEAHGDYV